MNTHTEEYLALCSKMFLKRLYVYHILYISLNVKILLYIHIVFPGIELHLNGCFILSTEAQFLVHIISWIGIGWISDYSTIPFVENGDRPEYSLMTSQRLIQHTAVHLNIIYYYLHLIILKYFSYLGFRKVKDKIQDRHWNSFVNENPLEQWLL